MNSAGFRADERVFDSICDELSQATSPYDFNTIPIHILGSIYQRFLGKTIVATDKRASLEDKPEVRKAGGVYYTPEYIVRYIVENTVGKLIEGKNPDEIKDMRFADLHVVVAHSCLGFTICFCVITRHTTTKTSGDAQKD